MAYTEDHLVEQPAIQLMQHELGWDVMNCFGEWQGGVSDLGREGKREVVLTGRLRAALLSLNPDLPEEAIDGAVEEFSRDRTALSLVEANREIASLLKGGVTVKFPDRENGGQRVEVVAVIDWEVAENNDFLLASQFWVAGALYLKRPDLIGFVNGLPLVLMELKAPGENVRQGYDKNIADYKGTIPQLFHYNGLIIVSNGVQSKIGSLTAKWEHYGDWKKAVSEEEAPDISLNTLLRGTCDKGRLLDLVENFTRFVDSKGSTGKVVARNHQFHGVNRAVEALLRTLTPALSQGEREEDSRLSLSQVGREEERVHYRGGFEVAGMVARARELRERQTPAEELLWEILRDRRCGGAKFRRQHQFGDYICDFYCHEAGLVVECDGEVHQSDEAKAHDKKRDAYLRSQKLKVLRFKNSSVLHKTEEVLTEILKDLPSTSGRGAGGEGSISKNRIGVFWHTQGSGKSYSMVFFAEKVFRKIKGNWTFVVITDRMELDRQISDTFANCGAANGKNSKATSASHLRELLTADHRYVFTLIHKFRTEPGTLHPVLSERDDIIVLTDEAHRSQYDTLAMNMRTALPNAKFVAFTGTPLIAGEERTREVFGEYVSVYDFKQSVEDGATVPLFYENRTKELEITNPELNEEIYQTIEDAGLDEDQEEKLKKVLGQKYHLITRDDRLDEVVKDIVHHFLNRGYQGKAMVVSIDKLTTLRMYEKVNAEWNAEKARVSERLAKVSPLMPEYAELNARLKNLVETDMAVVVSPGQNEITEMAAKGFDILPHRERMVKEDLEEKFKNPEDRFRLVFVCAMWLTGFDAPSCSTLYLDKPMRGHTLMQTIARANRVYGDKVNGLIVDYANVFQELEKALAIYGAGGSGGELPVKDKTELVEALKIALEQVTEYCRKQNVDLAAIPSATDKLFIPAVNQLIRTDEVRDEFLAHSNDVARLYKAVMPDPVIPKLAPKAQLIAELAKTIRAQKDPVNITEVMEKISGLLDGAIVTTAKEEPGAPAKTIDLSKIDFAALARKFEKSKTKNIEAQQLRALIERKLDNLIRLNASRYDFLDRFQKMIEEMNSGARSIAWFFEQLTEFTKDLSEEEQRHLRENVSEEELAVFDILTRPGPDLSPQEIESIKKVCRDLLAKLKTEKLVLEWRTKRTTRAAVRVEIEKMLDSGLPEKYTSELFETKCGALFQHVLEKYPESGESVYTNEVA
ncbi:HsdR family type I site-specific deoxyribonuclease [Luteolibacter algae]|uniref:Type I restriction enzyme endonuclease subunit n=1 Tax=Luteolibacter algae TaxID=454151 RepID=A0ABW5DC12_9BACT